MIAPDEIRQLSFHEKVQVMEMLWEGISREEDRVEVPQWHKDLLDERESLVREGKAQFVDWETAKKQISVRLP
jgi:putative addiction module component